jgi:rRNA maturation endonuclease Nob1
MENISFSQELQAKIEKNDPELQNLILALQSELVELRKQNAKLEVENLSLKSRIEALQGEVVERIKLAEDSLGVLKKIPPTILRELAGALREMSKEK